MVAGVRWIGGAASARACSSSSAALGERSLGVVVVAERQEVEGDEAGRRLAGQPLDPAGRRVDALLQHLELEPVADDDHDLAVDDAPFGQVGLDRLDDLGEVAGHRLLVARADLDLVAVAEDDRAEAVPLRFERQRAVGICGTALASIGATGGITGAA